MYGNNGHGIAVLRGRYLFAHTLILPVFEERMERIAVAGDIIAKQVHKRKDIERVRIDLRPVESAEYGLGHIA